MDVALEMVKNDFTIKFHFVKQGTSKPSSGVLENIESLEKMLTAVSDIFEEKQKVTGKGKFKKALLDKT